METLQKQSEIEFTRINNDVNGNPRYVCHFLELINDKDRQSIKEDFAASLALNPFKELTFLYELAVHKAKKIGGKKFHNKQYGGGIVFQSYETSILTKQINEIKNS